MPRQNSLPEKKIIQDGVVEYHYNFECQKKLPIINRSYKRIYEILTYIDEKQKDLDSNSDKPLINLDSYCSTHIDENLQWLPQLRNIIKKNISVIEKNLLWDPIEFRRFSNNSIRDFDKYVSSIIDCAFENIYNIFFVLDDLIFDKNQEYIYLMDRLDYYKKLFNKYYCQIDEAWYALGNTKNIELQNKLEKLQIYYSLIKRNFYLYEDDITKSKDVNSKKISPST